MSRLVSTKRLEEIADEVFTLMQAGDVFGFLDSSVGNMQALEQRLQEIMQTRQQFETEELVMYLRPTFSRQQHLPTWQPLLNAAYEMCLMRGDAVAMFYGLMPHEKTLVQPQHVGPRHPQLKQQR